MPSPTNISTDNIGRTEALLLLYLLDELSADERARVTQLLESDSAARSMFEQLQAANETIGGNMKRADAATPIGEFELASIARRTARLMSTQHVERLVRIPEPQPRQRWYPGARLITSVAASIGVLIALFVFWGDHVNSSVLLPVSVSELPNNADDGDGSHDLASNVDHDGHDDRRNGGWFSRPVDSAALSAADGLAGMFDKQSSMARERGVADAETQFERLHEVSDLGRSDTAAMTSQ